MPDNKCPIDENIEYIPQSPTQWITSTESPQGLKNHQRHQTRIRIALISR